MDQRLPASVSRVPFSLSSAQRGSDPLGFCQLPSQKFSRHRDNQPGCHCSLAESLLSRLNTYEIRKLKPRYSVGNRGSGLCLAKIAVIGTK
jgi:hypothetical protein